MDSNTTSDVFNLEDQQRLNFTNKIREKLIKEIIVSEDKPEVPEEKGDKALLVSLLDGMDRSTLSKAKIKTEDKAAKGSADACGLIAQVLRNISTAQKENIKTGSGTIPTLPKDIKYDEVQGETMLGTHSMNIDEFMQEQRKDDL